MGKGGKEVWYDRLFLRPLREVRVLGVEWEMMQVVLEPMRNIEGGGGRRGCCCLM